MHQRFFSQSAESWSVCSCCDAVFVALPNLSGPFLNLSCCGPPSSSPRILKRLTVLHGGPAVHIAIFPICITSSSHPPTCGSRAFIPNCVSMLMTTTPCFSTSTQRLLLPPEHMFTMRSLAFFTCLLFLLLSGTCSGSQFFSPGILSSTLIGTSGNAACKAATSFSCSSSAKTPHFMTALTLAFFLS